MLEFDRRFATEEGCLRYLGKLRCPEGFYCPRCGHRKVRLTKRALYRCRSCVYKVSVTAGTVFQDTKKPLQLWFRAICHVTSQKYGANALGLQRVLGLGSYHTAWKWLHKLRCAVIRPGRDRLSGEVDVDEIHIGGEKPGKRGRGAVREVLVIVVVEVSEGRIGRIRLKRVPDAFGRSLGSAIKEGVEPGSTVRTDGWRGYRELAKMGYKHEVVREEAEIGRNILQRVNRVVALLKRWLLGTYQGAVRPSHLEYYLD